MASRNASKSTAQRRAAKAQARFERAEARRRERRIVGWSLAGAVVVLGGITWAIWANADAGADPAPTPTASEAASDGSTEGPSEEATDGATDGAEATPDPTALPTTLPRMYDSPPPATDSLGMTWDVTLHTNVGDIELELDGAHAPQAVASFLMLSKDGFFDGTACHRLLPSSLLQCGDPTASGMGGPGYGFGPIENAPADDVYPAGTVAMARVGNDAESQGSQFFLVFNDVTLPSDSAGGYTVFGTVVQGLEILQSVGAAGTQTGASDGPPATVVIIEDVTIA
ncbi:peptidyl-prolyl cis-trans isomerase B (cyclophilin B) [Salana multivorans]|uniref:Peptidyl-prolyl cis-trans isomerase n=1 Tax=Salana multivorans TaxID=120377 RepID=A0A3N2D1F4_9MICO|nr:peptidylprolyl isomerase [Salana multivorans]ROR93609.1 peptidyl-prolyl cis-trans isomerase B (cyclophilin B) [Salana multivorans]